MWRRFVRWLAQAEVERQWKEGYDCGKSLGEAFGIARATANVDKAYAEGQQAGYQQAADDMANALRHRMGGVQDFVMPEDLKRALKGHLH